MSIPPSEAELRSLIRDKYDGNAHDSRLAEDVKRLASGEPLAYVIGWQPFLNLRIELASRPLIPRPETEWWTERLIRHLQERFLDAPFGFLDLCAGSGAIGLSVAKHLPNALVTLAELVPEHVALIETNAEVNGIPLDRIRAIKSDTFSALAGERFDVIASNPPYIPNSRQLPESVAHFEPETALISGPDGLELIRRIAQEVPQYLREGGEVWLEADCENVADASRLLLESGARSSSVIPDLYERPRLAVAYW